MVDESQHSSALRIVLTGFMGSGKSTVGRRLAERLRWRFLDLDQAVEDSAGKSVPRIFAEDGEASFRDSEAVLLARWLGQPHVVISLGGGAPVSTAVRDLLAGDSQARILHLHAPFSVLYDRCLLQSEDPDATARPLLSDFQTAEQRYFQRLPIYASVAHVTVDVAGEEPEDVVAAIMRIGRTWGLSSS